MIRVNIISRNNQAGLQKDKDILVNLLTDAGHKAYYTDVDNIKPAPPEIDLNIFCEFLEVGKGKVFDKYKTQAKYNAFIPNQEWFFIDRWGSKLKEFDFILVKTRHAEQIFKKLHSNVIYIGFTSEDHFVKVPKRLRCFHSAGKSVAKGTDLICKTYAQDDAAELPYLYMTTKGYRQDAQSIQSKANVIVNRTYVEQARFNQIQNESAIHLCTSEVEGFGHYINEARSAKAVIVAIDAPPMNELVTREYGYLIPAVKSKAKGGTYGTRYFSSPEHLKKTLLRIKSTPAAKLLEKGERARQAYLKDKEAFEQRFLQFIDTL